MKEPVQPAPASTVDEAEIQRFSALADTWWDPQGKMGVLHKFNPVRLAFIRDTVARHFGRDPADGETLKGLRLLDIGCGGGLLCEPMARLGADVVGADASPTNIEVARIHRDRSGVAVDYREATAEGLAEAGETFDVVLNMEVIEHVADTELFMRACTGMVRPGGLMFVATINRTAKAFALAIVGGEYVLRWLPRGTHSWNKFVRPEELSALLAAGDMRILEETGVIYNPLADSWRTSRDMDVNYMVAATKDGTTDVG
ncbi:MAG: bifunctional 2-polyprenyl-6-hydroxyphenol methylase/3-demethylubiquinol 3-O-methyltransferase UbiG [Rhodobiaceae bacterium]|nr:bifunctional 2-polyprenyl-6-hydroxyphenol methylase/3-demethylubiquinol 3-O-methyltransferase UbiG [Rhodobiaceae bacterium]MCC0056924.1 bifunctional 2-polyprenyl-6-hydroxyphenol methylase/3-demethylubiquinol 3-O-methyltransferase UbiG [Rhodobiaceae bacterium]